MTIALVAALECSAQNRTILKLKSKLRQIEQQRNHHTDTSYFNTINKLAFLYADSYPDSAISILKGIAEQCEDIDYPEGAVDTYSAFGNALQTKGNFDNALNYYTKAYGLAIKNNYSASIPAILGNIALIHLNKGNYPVALEKLFASLKAAEQEGNQLVIRNSLNNIGILYFYQGKMKEAEAAYVKTLKISKELKDTANVILAFNNIAEVNIEEKNLNKALLNLSTAYELLQLKKSPDMLVAVTNSLGDCYYRLDSLQKAEKYFENTLEVSRMIDNARATCKALIGLAKVNNKLMLHEKALRYGLEAVEKSKEMGQAQLQRDAFEIVADIYEQVGDGINALKYYKEFIKYSNSLVNIENERAAANLKAGYEFSKKEEAFQIKSLQQRWMIFSALAAVIISLIIIWIVFKNKKHLSNMYDELQLKNHAIEGQKKIAEETLVQLKGAQKQLIQSEKMASLGDLTAGIAHEIQNPLNFVNNFSEVSNELIQEIKDERAKNKDNRDEALLDEILNDISKNLEKISHHGKRADAIVKGMLQHSRSSSGTKVLTDINALCDEYLRLSYHGLRAKDKSFNSNFETDFDKVIGKVSVVPQDLGRVIMNLVNNAFYTVNEKQQSERLKLKAESITYEPKVSISTKKLGDSIEIRVNDNGNGIPASVKEKIFQPFFTTKPTGQGTGLGLSLSYDIVEAHEGKLSVESVEGKGTEFIIDLPF